MWTNEDRVKIEKLVKSYGRSRKLGELWEDLLHDVYIEQIERGDFSASFVRARIADVMRDRFGRRGHKRFKENTFDDFENQLPAPNPSPHTHILVRQLVSQLDGRELFVVESWLAGSTLKEIGAQVGITESRTCQIFNEALDRLAKVVSHR